MPNRRCRKTIHKKYRRYRCDLWGNLALKRKNDFITNMIYDYANQTLRTKLRRLSKKKQHAIKQYFGKSRKKGVYNYFAFQINVQNKQRTFRKNSKRGLLLRMRRQISLYYGGGRIRSKTFRRMSRFLIERVHPQTISFGKSLYVTPQPTRTYASLLESRIDVLLLRAHFVDSIYRARNLIFNRKCKVNGLTRVKHPSQTINNYQPFGFDKSYALRLRYNLRKRIISERQFLSTPQYLFVNYARMLAFLIENPITRLVSFPFSEESGSLANFRKSFRAL